MTSETSSSGRSACPETAEYTTYQLVIKVASPLTLGVGRLGRFAFPAGSYIYTGSARRNLEARIRRHCSKEKKLRWHIDYLLSHPSVEVVDVRRSDRPECDWNQTVEGATPAPGFGASDCRRGCGSHLKMIGDHTGYRNVEGFSRKSGSGNKLA